MRHDQQTNGHHNLQTELASCGFSENMCTRPDPVFLPLTGLHQGGGFSQCQCLKPNNLGISHEKGKFTTKKQELSRIHMINHFIMVMVSIVSLLDQKRPFVAAREAPTTGTRGHNPVSKSERVGKQTGIPDHEASSRAALYSWSCAAASNQCITMDSMEALGAGHGTENSSVLNIHNDRT